MTEPGKISGLTVLMPACNEEAGIAHAVGSAVPILDRICSDYEFIVINDGSKDRTGEILAELEIKHPGLSVLSYAPNRGYAEALRRGFAAATKPYIFFTDADMQFDVSEIPLLFERIGEADLVAGIRVCRQDSLARKLYSRVYNGMQRLFLGIRAGDINCAFKLFRREFITTVPLIAESFVINAEFFLRAKQRGARVAEVGVTHLPRRYGASTVRFTTVLKTLVQMVRLRFKSPVP
jgi:glycosyltransferase involved in cell wall biosynthesis